MYPMRLRSLRIRVLLGQLPASDYGPQAITAAAAAAGWDSDLDSLEGSEEWGSVESRSDSVSGERRLEGSIVGTAPSRAQTEKRAVQNGCRPTVSLGPRTLRLRQRSAVPLGPRTVIP